MGEVIRLAERMEARRTGPRVRPWLARAEFFFDLACPFTYLVSERVDRVFGSVSWTPASHTALRRGTPALDDLARVRRAAQDRAAQLRMPLSWPEAFPADVPAAMRVAGHAAVAGRGAAFALAAGRLAFCGGFDLDDPEILAEAAAAAGLSLGDCLRAAGDRRRDAAVEAAGRRLLAVGADRLPALRVGRALYWGESRVSGAVSAQLYLDHRAVRRRR